MCDTPDEDAVSTVKKLHAERRQEERAQMRLNILHMLITSSHVSFPDAATLIRGAKEIEQYVYDDVGGPVDA